MRGRDREVYLNMTIQVTDSEAGTKPDSITIWGVGHEAHLLYDTATVSIVKLPLDPSSGQVDYYKKGAEEDLLTIKYRSEGRFISSVVWIYLFHNRGEPYNQQD
ncbi:MAG: hypothetical protein R2744_04705 [Bacteroidales bacterium]